MSTPELSNVRVNEKLKEAENYLDCIFVAEASKLEVTSASDGTPRVRAYIPDEDGYAGWLENAMYIGAARQVSPDGSVRYLAEQHFPHRRPVLTYLYEYDTATGTLLIKNLAESEGTPPLDIPIEADQKHQGWFKGLAWELAHAGGLSDFESNFNQGKYEFNLPQLQ